MTNSTNLDNNENRILIAVLLCAAAVLFTGLWHGLPNIHIPDTHIVRNALGMAKTKTLWPAAGEFSTYPYLLSYILLPIYVATYGIGKLIGVYASAEDFSTQIVEDPTVIYLEARIMIAVFGIIAVYYIFKIARRLGFSVVTAGGASLFLAFNTLFVQLGHQARPWTPVVAGVAFTFYHSLGIATRSRNRDLILAAIGAGLTFAMHQVGGAVLIILASALLFRKHEQLLSGKKLFSLLKVIAVFAGVAVVFGYGHKIWGSAAHDVIQTEKSAINIGGQKLLVEAFSGERAWLIMKAFFGYDPVTTVLGIIGLVLAFIKGEKWKSIRICMALYCCFIAVLFLIYNASHIRYMLAIAPFMALGSAWAVSWISRSVGVNEVVVLAPLVLFSAVQAARMDLLYCRSDTRDLAKIWIEENIPEGSRISAEGYTANISPSQSSLTFLKEEAGVMLGKRERMILEGKLSQVDLLSYYLIPLERFYEFKSYWPHQYLLEGDRQINDFLDDMGTGWLMLADRWPLEQRHAPLMDYIAKKTELVAFFSPSDSICPSEATFPTDMDFPLTSLWKNDHPGPLIRLFKVKIENR